MAAAGEPGGCESSVPRRARVGVQTKRWKLHIND
jgi:hypothetical protein